VASPGRLIDTGVLDEHGDALYRFAVSVTRDPHLAADLVQDTYVRALERGEQYRGEASLRTWLRRILYNLAVDRARRSAREVIVEEVEDDWREDSYTVDPSIVVERTQTREELEDALARLPFPYRTAVILHDAQGWKVAEIADTQQITLAAAKQRLRRGRMALVSALADGAERRVQLKGVPMRCWDARRHVSDYLSGTLEAERAGLVEAHLGVCPTCPPLYAALVGANEGLGSLRDKDSVVPPDVEQRIRRFLAE